MASFRILTSTLTASRRSSSFARLSFHFASHTQSTKSIYSSSSSLISFCPQKPENIPIIPTAFKIRSFSTANKTIEVGDKLPDATLSYFDREGTLQTVSIAGLAAGKKNYPPRSSRGLHSHLFSEASPRIRSEGGRAQG